MPDVIKEHDKFADIVDAVGIAPSLLKGGGEDADTNLPSKLPWRLPEECGPFLVWILDNYTSSDFKALRKANFHDVSLETAGKLINGFCSILTGLGFSGYTVERQRRKMSSRMRYTVRSSRREVESTLRNLSKLLDKYDAACFGMRKDELAYFLGFINAQVKELTSYIDEVYENYVDIRHDELSDLAWDEAAAMDEREAMEHINETLILGDALEKDAQYQKLNAERERLLNGNDFVKNVEKRFAHIGEEMDTIRRRHELRLFGHELPDEGTILVDPNVFFMYTYGTYRSTVVHECVHWSLHRRFFELEKLYNPEAKSIQCQVQEGSREEKSALLWSGWSGRPTRSPTASSCQPRRPGRRWRNCSPR